MVVVVVAEFLGTFLFLFLAFAATQTALNTQVQTDVPSQNSETEGGGSSPLLPVSFLYIAAAFGTSLAINVWVFYRVSGGMFNPSLLLTIYFLAAEKHRATFLAPIGIGISAFIAHLAGTPYTGTSINPVRSFGPDVITGFVRYHWIFWVAPCFGAVLAIGVYKLMKCMDYEDVNGGQDAADTEAARGNRLD
ncbi:aquaporin-2 [Emericellopsis cladophorae]|uniref:Aquaporin-2 n=1 Tax=Emericellopsis cladophorae TaxID=2686198 RepID=A0A9Q0BB36_9HYPO|nr:aquaporin-2 [Emericellopsis cladophorae]KAI6777634.1 aquaporin-2 [Emericellopsis cladophorae]